MAMAARMPMMATTIISSMSVKPRWLPTAFLFFIQNIVIVFPPFDMRATEAHMKSAIFLETGNCILGAKTFFWITALHFKYLGHDIDSAGLGVRVWRISA